MAKGPIWSDSCMHTEGLAPLLLVLPPSIMIESETKMTKKRAHVSFAAVVCPSKRVPPSSATRFSYSLSVQSARPGCVHFVAERTPMNSLAHDIT